MKSCVVEGQKHEAEWTALFTRYAEAYPEQAAQYKQWLSGELPEGWESVLPVFDADSKMATRASSGKVINAIAPAIVNLVGGSADLTGSNKTGIDGSTGLSKRYASRSLLPIWGSRAWYGINL